MIFLFTMTYPGTSAADFGKAVIKNFQEHPWPDFARLTGAYAAICEDRMKAYAILEIEKGKEDETFKVADKRLANYISIPGFRYKEERLITMEEALDFQV